VNKRGPLNPNDFYSFGRFLGFSNFGDFFLKGVFFTLSQFAIVQADPCAFLVVTTSNAWRKWSFLDQGYPIRYESQKIDKKKMEILPLAFF